MTQDARAFSWDSISPIKGLTTDPAAGAQPPNITVPAGKRWKLISIECTVVCDGTAANRYFQIFFEQDGTNVTFSSVSGLVITAGQTKRQSFITGSLITTAGTQYGIHLPDVTLVAGCVILTTAFNLVVGDNCTAVTYYYQEAPA